MTRAKFTAAMAVLTETFNREMSQAANSAYWLVLEDLSAEEISRATTRALAECRFMPAPSELLTFAGRTDPAVAKQLAAAEAWEAVRSAIRRESYTAGVDFGELVNAVVRNLGGWRALCDKSTDELTWVRKEFERVFALFATKSPGSLNGAAHGGAFGGETVRIPIAGVMPDGTPRISATSAVVRALADSKSA